MKNSHQKVVHIRNATDNPSLSKTQKQFNTLIKKIDGQKQLLRQWQETISTYHSRLNGEYESLWDDYNQYRVQLVYLFDSVYQEKLFTKTDRNKLRHLINIITLELITEHGIEELKDLYNKYNETDFDSEHQADNEEAGEMLKAMMKGMLGIEIEDDIDVSSPENWQAALHAKLAERQEQEEQQKEREEEKRRQRKKTAKQLEKEAKLQKEAQNISKSIQEVYRKLASAIHPDREQDETERERKTKIMQEVNVAYGKKDLLRLLELQLELEHIDQTHLSRFSEDRLKHFNKILKEQLNELQDEIQMIEYSLKMQSNWHPFSSFSPEALLAKMEYDVQDVARDVSRLQVDVERFKTPQNLKSYLKTYKIPKPPVHHTISFEDMFFH